MSYIDHISRPTATFVSHSSFFLNNSIVMQFLTNTRPDQNLIRQSIFQLQVLKDATVLPVTAHQVSFHITEIQKSLLNQLHSNAILMYGLSKWEVCKSSIGCFTMSVSNFGSFNQVEGFSPNVLLWSFGRVTFIILGKLFYVYCQ